PADRDSALLRPAKRRIGEGRSAERRIGQTCIGQTWSGEPELRESELGESGRRRPWTGDERVVATRGRGPHGGRARGGVDATVVGDCAQTSRGATADPDQRDCGFGEEPVAAADWRAD